MSNLKSLIPVEVVENRIYLIREQKVMLSPHLAELYQVETRALVQAVKRNGERFPEDFMFQLSDKEFADLKSQIVISSWGGSRRAKPYAFTEQGIAMLSSVLNSKRAIQVNIQIMRVFTRLRQILLSDKDLRRELEELKQVTDDRFRVVFETLDQLLSNEERPKRKIGFKVEEKKAAYRVTKKRSVN
ncbi:MAG: ORF6N domain-containing protein [Desulfobacterales bacterium]|jgi:DNA-binding PadR family transcriptional regulator|nr:ORF6N domain-containing protein [Desulfobacterales bacterium]